MRGEDEEVVVEEEEDVRSPEAAVGVNRDPAGGMITLLGYASPTRAAATPRGPAAKRHVLERITPTNAMVRMPQQDTNNDAQGPPCSVC